MKPASQIPNGAEAHQADELGRSSAPNVELSVVVITKDQAWNIDRLLASVFREAEDAQATPQVIVVDSASSDETVERAMQWDVDVVGLDADQRLSASMGRYAGYLRASGRFLVFLDGDMELWPGWLRPALEHMRRTPDIAAMDGQRLFVPQDCSDPRPRADASTPAFGSLTPMLHIGGGAGLYRREALERAGGFNPYLISDEEPDLGLRMRSQGYRLLRTQGYVGVHYGDEPTSISTLLRRRRRRLYHGFGQNMRFYWGTPLFRRYLRERGFWIPGAILLLTVPALLFLGDIPASARALLLLPAVAVAGVILASGFRRGWRRTAFSIVMRLVVLDGAIRGAFLPLRTPENEPVRMKSLKRSSLSSGAAAAEFDAEASALVQETL